MSKLKYRIGHRGRPGNPRHAENTMLSFREAVRLGANALEFDVRRAGDGVLVVVHDETMYRVTNEVCMGSVWRYTSGELSRMDVGFGQGVPTLEKVLNEFDATIQLNIELKEAQLARDVRDMIVGRRLQDCVIVSAFDVTDDIDGNDGTVSWDELAVFRPQGIPIALLAGEEKIWTMGYRQFVDIAISRNASAINPSLAAVSPPLIALAHEHGLEVNVWTVNEPADIERLVSWGVDGIFCDCVERLAPYA